MKALFLFDIDGTILSLKCYHSKHLFYRAFTDLFGKCAEPDIMPHFSGMTDLQIIDDLCGLSELPRDYVFSRISELWKRLSEIFVADMNIDNVVLMPHIEEFLEYLQLRNDVTVALVTGNFRENAYLKLGLFGLDKYFETGAFGSDEANRNLLPSIAIERANKLYGENFTNADSVIIGDSPSDIKCAKASKCISVGVATGWHSTEVLSALKPDFLYENFADYERKTDEIMNRIRK